MNVQRYDVTAVRGVQRTPQGGRRVDAAISRTGVLMYRDDKGDQWGELRSPDEVFAADSLESLRGAPVTDHHPGGLVTPATWKQVSKGHVGDDVRRDGEYVAAPIVVNDAEEVALIDARQRHDVSAGYTCDIDPTPGVHDGIPYRQVQRNIRFNHVALLPFGAGRSGTDVALRMDGAAIEVPPAASLPDSAAKQAGATQQTIAPPSGAPTSSLTASRTDAQEPRMKIKVGDKEFEIRTDADVAPVQAAVDTVMADCAAAKSSALDTYKKVAALEASMSLEESKEAAPVETDATVAPEEVLDAKSARRLVTALLLGAKPVAGMRRDAVHALVTTTIDAKADARSADVDAARADAMLVLGDKYETKGKTPLALRTEVLAKVAPSVKMDSAGVYEAAMAAYRTAKPDRTRNDSLGRMREEVEGNREMRADDATRMDADDGSAEWAYAQMNKAALERSRAPLAGSK